LLSATSDRRRIYSASNKMPTRLVRAGVTLILAVCLAVTSSAAGAQFWQVATQSDFLKGDVSNLSIDLHGRLVLGPETTPVGTTSTPFLWTMVAGPDGSVFVGSGNGGEVLRFTADGKQSVFFDSAELEVHALALAPGGELYVGTSPEGRIYKVNAQGTATTYFDPEDKYIWALAVDNAGTLYAATGEKGVIYRVTAQGEGKPFYRTKATHARTLTFDRNGNLLAGTESPGKVFRIDKSGAGFVLLDSGLQEISALRVDDRGIVYAGGLTGRPPSERGPDRAAVEPSRSPTPVPSVSTEITSITIVDATGSTSGGGSTQPPRQERRSIRGAVYRILPDGVWDTVWNSPDDAPYDLLPHKDGSLLVATGNAGKLYRIESEPARATLIVSADAQQITTLLRDKSDQLWFATANSGKVYRLSTERATRGTYESTVRDAETVATWGAISWRGSLPAGSTIKVFTRSGNTAVPDETWSPWSAPYTKAVGEQVTSPKARYLQWKAELTGSPSASPVVTSVTVAYLQRNLRPEINTITVYPSGVVFQKPFSTGDAEIAGFEGTTADRRAAAAAQAAQSGGVSAGSPPLGRRGYEKGLQTFLWKAEDGNDDDLQYEVQYRREGDTTWKVLKRGLTEPLYVWDTTSVPNGTYVIKVIASDSPSNPPGSALLGERESESVDIDNAPPDIAVTSIRRDGGRSVVAFSVKDDHSAVSRVEYSLDGDRWRAIHPRDGIADSVSEEFELTLEGDTSGRAVIIRAEDAMENVTTTRAEAPVSSR
jgi:hypothetical protein